MRIALVDPSRTTRLVVARMLEARGHEVVRFADEREGRSERPRSTSASMR